MDPELRKAMLWAKRRSEARGGATAARYARMLADEITLMHRADAARARHPMMSDDRLAHLTQQRKFGEQVRQALRLKQRVARDSDLIEYLLDCLADAGVALKGIRDNEEVPEAARAATSVSHAHCLRQHKDGLEMRRVSRRISLCKKL